ncbi:unnamed protein product [Moneuplotes crassus]|uniref:TAFII28-like protein domain-containing protein n=1 Tax=Euplotes crassus TaxID=5936 RepID=A0AAD1XUX9_EUPCR|nr:unnamed protein product [Moneuplotes crassus]
MDKISLPLSQISLGEEASESQEGTTHAPELNSATQSVAGFDETFASENYSIGKLFQNNLVDKEAIYDSMTPEEQERYERCREFVIPHQKIKYVVESLKIFHGPNKNKPGPSWKIQKSSHQMISGLAKLYLSRIIEDAKDIQINELIRSKGLQTEEEVEQAIEENPLTPDHIHQAYIHRQKTVGLFKKVHRDILTQKDDHIKSILTSKML